MLLPSQGQGGLHQFRCSPSARSIPYTPMGSSRPHLQVLHLFRGLRRDTRGSAPTCSSSSEVLSRGGRIRDLLRTAQLLPPMGLSTCRFDAERFLSTPGTCYRVPWRLPGPDLHRLANSSFASIFRPLASPPFFVPGARCPWSRCAPNTVVLDCLETPRAAHPRTRGRHRQ
jgi:hypothetical protein